MIRLLACLRENVGAEPTSCACCNDAEVLYRSSTVTHRLTQPAIGRLRVSLSLTFSLDATNANTMSTFFGGL